MVCSHWIAIVLAFCGLSKNIMHSLRCKEGVPECTGYRSKWSPKNIERAEKMIQEGKMAGSGLKKFKERIEYDKALETISLEIPPELEKALKKNIVAWKNFHSFSPSYRKQYILWGKG